jgi:hypothetical protein
MKNRYTVYGDKAFDAMIDEYMVQIKDAVLEVMPEEYLSALILGGGYGRGEGGVFIENGKMELYNDFDFFVISNNLSRAKMNEYYHKLFEVGEKLTEKIGIDVDFGPFRNISDLANMKFTMMWYELKQAHIVIYGDDKILDAIPDFKAEEIPLSEAMGLTLNRSVGLLLAKQRLENVENLTTPDKDFIERNIYKAAMAAGDAFLICNHIFNHSYVARMDLMDQFKDDKIIKENKFLELYKRSILYKLKPVRKNLSHKELSSLHSEVLDIYKKFFLFVAGKAWRCEFADFKSFGETVLCSKIDADSPIQILKNMILNIKEVGGPFSLRWFLKYPRYRLFYAVPYFAFMDKTYEENIPAVLGLDSATSEEEKLQQFLRLWERFN